MRSIRTRLGAIAALALWVLGPVTASAAARSLELPKIQDAALAGDFKIKMLERHELPLVTLLLTFEGGSAADPVGQEGLANLTAELLRTGAGKRDAQTIAKLVDSMGAELGSHVDRDTTQISLEVLSKDLPVAVELLADLVMQPSFSAEELERTRRQLLAALQDVKEDPSKAATVAFMDQLYRGHPYGHPELGYERSVSKVTREEVLKFHRGVYRPERAHLVAVGDFKGAELRKLVSRAFASWPKQVSSHPALKMTLPPLPAEISGQKLVVVHRPGLTQAQIRIGNLGYAVGEPSEAALVVANTALGGGFTSRLVDEIRVNRSLSYGASSRFTAWKQPGPFLVTTFTKNETLGETVRVALETVARFKAEPMKPDEFSKARNFSVGRFASGVETPEALAAWLTRLEVYHLPLEFLTGYAVRLDAVKPEDIQAVLPRIPRENVLIVLFADHSKVAVQLEAYGKYQVIDSLEYTAK